MNLNEIYRDADFVLMAVLLILLAMSIISWMIIFSKIIKLSQQKNYLNLFLQNNYQPSNYQSKFFTFNSIFSITSIPPSINFKWIDNIFSNKLEISGENALNSPQFSALNHIIFATKNLENILQNYHSHDAKKEVITLHLSQALDEIKIWFDKGLTILASIGSCSPFIGLFGTVWGIYHALGNIANKGSVGLNIIAGPIAESLIATAIGLFCAIPAVLAYNAFVRAHKLMIQNLRHLAEQITVHLSNQRL